MNYVLFMPLSILSIIVNYVLVFSTSKLDLNLMALYPENLTPLFIPLSDRSLKLGCKVRWVPQRDGQQWRRDPTLLKVKSRPYKVPSITDFVSHTTKWSLILIYNGRCPLRNYSLPQTVNQQPQLIESFFISLIYWSICIKKCGFQCLRG